MRLVLPDIKGPTTITFEPSLARDERYFEFCERNPDSRIERTAEGKIVIMSPADGIR